MAMRAHRYPVLVETAAGCVFSGFCAWASDPPTSVAIRLREKGWAPYKINFDIDAGAWIASVIDWKKAA
jgi:hypothetical protein